MMRLPPVTVRRVLTRRGSATMHVPVPRHQTRKVLMLTCALTAGSLMPRAQADPLDDIANQLDAFGGGGPMGFFPALGGVLAVINSASSFLSMIPGLGSLVSGIQSAMNVVNDIQIAFGPIMQTAKNVAQYVRGAAEGKRSIEKLFGANDLNDAATALNQLTALAGGKVFVSGQDMKQNAAQYTQDTVAQIDSEIRTAQASLDTTTDPRLRSVIQQRLSMLVSARRRANHTGAGVRAMQENQKIASRSTAIPGQQAQVAMQMMTAAASATTPTATGKVTVAAITEQTSAVTNGLANLSQQMTEQAGLQVATNDSLDVLVEETAKRAVRDNVVTTLRENEDQRRILDRWHQGQSDARVAASTIDNSVKADSVKDFKAADILFK